MIAPAIRLYRNAFSGLSRDIWILALVTLVNRAGTMVIPFMTVYLTHEKGFTLQQAGWVMSSFGLGSVLGSYVGGRLTDRFSFFEVQFWTLFLSGFMFWVLRGMDTLAALCITIFVLCTISDAFRPANLASVAVYSKPENRTRSFSLVRLAINLGFAVGPAIGGILAASKGYSWLFWVDGLTCIIAAILLRILLKPKKSNTHQESEATMPQVRQSAYRDRPFLWLILLTTINTVSFMQMFSTYPVFLRMHFQLSEDHIGMLLALNGLIIAVIEMLLVYSLERRYKPTLLIGIGYCLIAASYSIFNVTGTWFWVPTVSIIIVTFGEIFMFPFTNSIALARANPANRGQYMALYSMSFAVGHILGPAIGMQLAGLLGFKALWWAMSSLSMIGFIGLQLVKHQLDPIQNPVVVAEELVEETVIS